jgi:hypothetical protein
MDEKLTLTCLGWNLGLVIAVIFVMDAFALAALRNNESRTSIGMLL